MNRLTSTEWIRAESLRLGAEALRAEAESSDGLGTLGDPDGAARDRAAAAILDAIAADADALRADAEATLRRLEIAADELASDEFPEDRVSRLGVLADPRDFAASLLDAIEGERLRIANAACGILARRILADPASLDDDARRALADAIRMDWTTPDR
jgi:hypothetical protein